MKKEIWMPHAGHFICGNDCRFHLATVLNERYIVSTVGEYEPDSAVREILANSRGVVLVGRGDERRADYMKKIGYEKIGCDCTYETMVFKAVKDQRKCCPFKIIPSELDFEGYNDAGKAMEGHMRMVKKWKRKK